MDTPEDNPMTPGLAAYIKHLLMTTRLFQHQIAAMVGVNQGRVSEVKTGKRFPNVPPSDQMPRPA